MNDDLNSLIYNKSLDLISRREHSRGELYIKLIKRYPDAQELINETLDKLNFNKLLNDARFAEMYVMARAKKGFGPQRIKMELQQKQVGSIEITDAIEAFEGWDEILRHELEKKYKQPTEDFKEIMKRKQFLYNRGFSQAQIESVLDQS